MPHQRDLRFYIEQIEPLVSDECNGLAWLKECQARGLTPEEAWKTCERGDWMLWYLRRFAQKRLSDTEWRLMACAFVRETPAGDGRTVWDLLVDPRSRRAVEVAEAFANGQASRKELHHADSAAYAAYIDLCASRSAKVVDDATASSHGADTDAAAIEAGHAAAGAAYDDAGDAAVTSEIAAYAASAAEAVAEYAVTPSIAEYISHDTVRAARYTAGGDEACFVALRAQADIVRRFVSFREVCDAEAG